MAWNFEQKPVYHFKNGDDLGIDKVPDNRIVVVDDFRGHMRTFMKQNNDGVDASTTIEQAYDNNNIGQILKEEIIDLSDRTNIDVKEGCYFKKTITENTEFTFEGTREDGVSLEFILEIVNGGSYALIWPASVTWHTGTPPTFVITGTDILGFYSLDNGVTWRGMLMAKDIR